MMMMMMMTTSWYDEREAGLDAYPLRLFFNTSNIMNQPQKAGKSIITMDKRVVSGRRLYASRSPKG